MPKPQQKYNVICLSNQLWDFPNWTNKRHVMSRLAKKGHTVLFVDPQLNVGFVFARQLKRGYWNLKRFLMQYKKDESSALIYTPLNIIPFFKITSNMHIRRINNLAKRHFIKKQKTILWVYNVQMLELQEYIEKLEYDILVYDCVDNYAGFPDDRHFYTTTISKEGLLEQERNLTMQADVVFATAPGLVDRLRKDNEHVYFMPNVGDYEAFKDTKSFKDKLPDDIKNIPRPRIGFIGALDDYKFDINLLKKIAMDHPGYSFVIIGPMALKDKDADLNKLGFSQLENVHLLGSRPYEEKVKYLAGFDVDIIPYQVNDYTVGGCFPVKFHDSLAAGLPVVVTDLPAYMPFDNVCYISKSYTEFSKNIERALQEDNPSKIKDRQKVAKQNNWDGKVENMINKITEVTDNLD